MRRRWLGVLLLAVPVGLAVSTGCTVNVTSNAPSLPPPASKTVGASGGTVATTDGSAQVDVPAGALPSDTTITITANASAPAPAGATVLGTAFTFGPDGLKFLKPVTVTLAFDSSKLPEGTAASTIVVYTAPDGSSTYEPLPTSVKDGSHVAATTTHFSTDVPGVGGGAADAQAPVCVQGGAHCAGTSGPGCGAQTPTCASTDLCARFPGSTVQSCTADVSGADATCCYPPGTPTCFHTGGAGCTGCPAPTCASADPCAYYAGSTMQSCTDGVNNGGLDAVCCFPAGTPMPGGGDGGASDGGTPPGDGGIGPDSSGCNCIPMCNGTGTACNCNETCNGHMYAMSCDGQTGFCRCGVDGTPTTQFAQGSTCSGAQTSTAFETNCALDGGGPPPPTDAAPPDAGCTPSCGGGSNNICNCNSTCAGHAYQMACNGQTCQCVEDGTPTGSFVEGTTCSGAQPASSLAGFGTGGCNYPTQ